MSRVLTSNELITSIKRRGSIPTDQRTFSTQDFLDLLNEEISTGMVPFLLDTHDEYLVHSYDYPIDINQKEYAIPDRAIGNKLRAAMLKDVSGNMLDMTRINLEDISMFQNGFKQCEQPFYIQDNKIVLVAPNWNIVGYLRMIFYIRPNELVEDKYAGIITNIDRTTGIITMSNFPDNFSSIKLFDFLSAGTPNRIYNYDIPVVATDSNTKSITLNPSNISPDLKIGDHICEQGKCIVPLLPTELHPILAQKVALTCVEAMGDQEAAALLTRKLQVMETATTSLIDNRVENANQKINPRHRLIRMNRSSRFGRRIT